MGAGLLPGTFRETKNKFRLISQDGVMNAFLVLFLKRIYYGLILIFAVIVLNFTLIHLAPGDPATTIAGEMGGATEEIIGKIRSSYGLDKSLPLQLITYIKNMITGDLGFSFFYNAPVIELITQRVSATLFLVITALCLAIIGGTFFGVFASRNPNGNFSHLVTILSLAGYSAPVFWTGIMLLILFSSVVSLFPVTGMRTIGIQGGIFIQALDIIHHLVLPTTTLAIVYMAPYSRLARASMLETLESDYIRSARAKGLSERVVVYKHALKNSVLPVVTYAGMQFSQIFAGAVLVETVFDWPGLGRLAFESLLRRDYPTMLGILFFSSAIVIIANIITDLCYRLLDPRIGNSTNR
jgi:peptide/nickel transport system permease protein